MIDHHGKKDMLKNDFGTLIKRLLIVVVVSFLLKLLFYCFNYEKLGEINFVEIPNLLRGSFLFEAANISMIFGVFIIVSLLPTQLRSRDLFERIKFWTFVAALVVLVLFGINDTIYYHFTGRRGMADDLVFAGHDNTFGIMLKAALENWIVVLCGTVILILAIYAYKKIKYYPFRIESKIKYLAINSGLFLLGIFMMFFFIRGSSLTGHPIYLNQASRYVSEPVKASLVLTNPFCIIHTSTTPTEKYTKYFKQEELTNIYSPIHYPKKDSVDSGAKNKNVVLFILEGFSHELSGYLNPDLYPKGESVTPFLDSLMQHSYVFRNAYSNGYGSRDAMGSVYNSIPTFKEIFMQMPQSLNATSSIASVLNGEGYTTSFFNGSTKTLMGFDDYARVVGFSHTYSQESYLKKHSKEEYDGRWGIWDEPFLQFMGDEISAMKEPFFSSVFTITSHHPFVIPEKYESTLPVGYTKSHQSLSYTDLAVKRFFDTFKDSAWFKNTIFVMVADHTSPEIYAKRTLTPTGKRKIIYFMYTPDGSLQGETYAVTQQIDIMPTLLGLLKYEKPYFAFGQDFFAADSTENYAINYADGLFILTNNDANYYFDESKLTNVYADSDTLNKNNILGQNPAKELQAERKLKAFIQTYYQQLEHSNFSTN